MSRKPGLEINGNLLTNHLVVSNPWLLKMSLSNLSRLVKISVIENVLTCVSFLHKIVFPKQFIFLKDMRTT